VRVDEEWVAGDDDRVTRRAGCERIVREPIYVAVEGSSRACETARTVAGRVKLSRSGPT